VGIVSDVKVLAGQKEVVEKTKVAPKKVLVVDDEKPLLEALSSRLAEEGYQIFKAENGKEALDLAIANKPDILLLDLIMPVMDGVAVLKNLREIPEFKGLPVIVLTNAGDIENVRNAQFYYNAAEFLIKSNVNMEDIVQKVKEAI